MPARTRPRHAPLSLAAISLIAAATVAHPALAAAVAGPKVETVDGVLEGSATDGVNVFKGIPYAQPPIGPNRWRAPQPATPWSGVREAKTFGPACLQKVARQEPERSLKNAPQSEDCLTLNIWAPAEGKPAASPRPVMVWVHGGSFRFGAGSLDLYNGMDLAHRGAIVVNLNYRLGLFGTFAHPDLAASDEPSGNFGLLDVMQALRWVKANIGAFGGDPDNVTLFGESAGGATVAYLMTSPLAHGLFDKAIIESGALALPEYDRQKAISTARKIATGLNAESLEALRKLPASAIRDADTGIADTMPYIDGTILPAGMRESFESGKALNIPIIIGSNSAEAGFFGQRYWHSVPDDLGDKWPTVKAACFDYGKASDDACAEQIATEQFAGVNTRAVERAASGRAPVYAYRFDYLPPQQRGKASGAIHTAEIPYVFGHIATEGQPSDSKSKAVSDNLASRWVAFARTGSPNMKQDGDWTPFVRGDNERLLLIGNDGEKMKANPADALLNAIEAAGMGARP